MKDLIDAEPVSLHHSPEDNGHEITDRAQEPESRWLRVRRPVAFGGQVYGMAYHWIDRWAEPSAGKSA